jgi:hypothetical protein
MTTLVNGLHSACACHREGWSTVSWKASDAAQGSAEAEPVIPVTCLGKVAIKMSSALICSFVLVLLICSCPWGCPSEVREKVVGKAQHRLMHSMSLPLVTVSPICRRGI